MGNFNIGQTIRDLRNEHHYSQTQLGELLNVTDSTVSKWESGDSNPGIDQINAMAQLFGMTVDAFLHYQEAKNAEAIKREAEEKAQLERNNRAVREKLSNSIFVKVWDQQLGFCDKARIVVEYDGTTLTLHQKENPNVILYDSCIGIDSFMVENNLYIRPCACFTFCGKKWEECPAFEDSKNRWRILFDFTHPIERIRFSFNEPGIEDYEFGVQYVAADREAYERKIEEENRKKLAELVDVQVLKEYFSSSEYRTITGKIVNVIFNAVSDAFSYATIELYYVEKMRTNLLKTYRLNDGEKIWAEDKLCKGYHFILKQFDAKDNLIYQSDMKGL